ncbi:hypothetical protein G6F22_013410 [Rhizopus arrhizus]|nr:hypothetical protein G6F22_013410 [Rhizopus arrhizus]
MMPSSKPPAMAPTMLPMPPNTAAVKAFRPSMKPIRRTDQERGRNDRIDVHAHQARHFTVLRGSAHRRAQAGLVHHGQQAAHDQRRNHHDGDLQRAHARAGEFEDVRRQHLREVQVVAAPAHHRHVLQDDGHADRGDQRRQARRTAQRPVGHALGRPAHRHAQRHGHQQAHAQHHEGGHAGITAHQRNGDRRGRHGADHDDVAMREVDQPDDAVHHGVAKGDQGVHAA